jgi:hypothetical protein
MIVFELFIAVPVKIGFVQSRRGYAVIIPKPRTELGLYLITTPKPSVVLILISGFEQHVARIAPCAIREQTIGINADPG